MIFAAGYKVAGTKSGRLSSQKLMGTFANNIQNISDHMRRLFVPRPAYRFAQNDLEGAEAVAVALYVTEGNFRELVRRKIKIHNFVCVKIFPALFEKFFTKAEIDALTPQAFHESPHYKAVVAHCKSLKIEYALAKRTVHGCLTDDHEVLTKNGWKNIASVAECAKDEIAVWAPNADAYFFELPKKFIAKPYCGDIVRVHNGQCEMLMTANHSFAYLDHKTEMISTIDAELLPYFQYEWELPIYTYGRLRSIPEKYLSIQVAERFTKVYCFTTSTGFFLCRHKEKKTPFVTGNSNYSMGWKTFQENILKETAGRVVLPAAECKRLLSSYFDLFPEVKVFQTTFDKHAQEFTEFENLFGWKIKCVQRYTTAVGRTCISWGPQSTVGVATIQAGQRFQLYLEDHNRNWNLLNCVHDSLLVEAPVDEVVEAANVLADCMSFTFTSPVDGWQCTIGVEKSVGDNWGKYDEKENPSGMKVIV